MLFISFQTFANESTIFFGDFFIYGSTFAKLDGIPFLHTGYSSDFPHLQKMVKKISLSS